MAEKTEDQLKGSFGDKGTKVNQIAYGHPHAEKIIEEAKAVLKESETGRKLVGLIEQKKVPVHIIKGTGESGFSPELMTLFIQMPGKTDKASGLFIVQLIKGLREAAQELGGAKTPDPLKDVIEYAEFVHARNLDALETVCKVVKELTNSLHFPVLLDTLSNIGLNKAYKAYLSGVSEEEFYMEYASAYNNTDRGS